MRDEIEPQPVRVSFKPEEKTDPLSISSVNTMLSENPNRKASISSPFWRRYKYLIIAGGGLLVVGIVLAIVLPITLNRSTENSPQSSTTPAILTTTEQKNPESSTKTSTYLTSTQSSNETVSTMVTSVPTTATTPPISSTTNPTEISTTTSISPPHSSINYIDLSFKKYLLERNVTC